MQRVVDKTQLEEDETYPEIEKIILLSKEYNVTIDSLLNADENNIMDDDDDDNDKKINKEKLRSDEQKSTDQKIHIESYDGQSLASYYELYLSPVFKPTEKQPKYTLMATYKYDFGVNIVIYLLIMFQRKKA